MIEPEGNAERGVFQFKAAMWFIFMLDMKHFWKNLTDPHFQISR